MCDQTTTTSGPRRGLSDVQRPAGGGAPSAPPGGRSSSLDALETTGQIAPQSVQGRAAHAGHESERAAVLGALAADPDDEFGKQVRRMGECCSCPHVGSRDDGRVGVVWFRCRHRLCPLCSKARAQQTAEKIEAACSAADALRFLTLTLRSSDGPLGEQLDRLFACFREFRRTVEWRRHVRGGVYTFEATWNESTGQWHPHLHVLIDGGFWEQQSIAAAWERCTGDSRIVDIRAVHSKRKAASYVAKYAAKPPSMESWPPERIRDYARGVRRRRLVHTFGTMHGVEVDRDEEHAAAAVTEHRIPLALLERRSQLGCPLAARVLTGLADSSSPYRNTLKHRDATTYPRLAGPTAANISSAGAALSALHRLYEDDPVRFLTGGDGDWIGRPRPKPKRRRTDDGSQLDLDSTWREQPRRHW